MRLNLLLIFTFYSLSCLGQTQSEFMNYVDEVHANKILIVFFSRTNNTKAVAEMIHEKVGGKLVSLKLETPYPKGYDAVVAQVAKENEENILPHLKTKISLKEYEIIYVGFPTWGMQLPPPMKTFLSENDFEAKTVIPFNTNAGFGIGSSFETVKKFCPKSHVLKGFSTQGGIERDGILYVMEGEKETEVRQAVNKWLESLQIFTSVSSFHEQ
ncbi:flavodoxin family protein [Cyclobacterium marinum]|uniref:Flavodoxin n=1 Tax=Cyclobacterium marinum (strain ATCC 25205 / DSM 745 / LMG 13164 / NCIMB 1802) TaxID=880070 RepID=G0J098_CYCMS|nr:flavodoxin [Cyclobacterium marinum]AEL28171.1 flavodoxin [Cyclobacterium marinum DSM 745]